MKKTDLKDALRNIRKNLLSWISIIFIAGIAVAAYLGIRFSASGMRSSGNEFYQKTSFRDYEITSTMLLTEEDIELIKNTKGVADVEGVYFSGGTVTIGDKNENVNAVSLTERINTPLVISGKLPEKADECAVEDIIAENLGLGVGDSISIKDTDGNTPKYLKDSQYMITGIVQHPDHLAKPAQTPGSRYVLLIDDAFDTESLKGCYMRAEIRLDNTSGLSYYSDEYLDIVKDTEDRLKTLAQKREKLRYQELYGDLEKEIEDKQKQLDDAKAELDDARKQLDDGWNELEDGEEKLKTAEDTILQSDDKLAEAKKALDDAQKQIDEKSEELEAGKEEFKKGSEAYASADAELKANRKTLDDSRSQLVAGEKEYSDNFGKYSEASGKLDDAKKVFSLIGQYRQKLIDEGKDVGSVSLDAVKEYVSQNGQSIPDEFSDYSDLEELYNGIEDKISDLESELSDSKAALDFARAQLDDGWAKLDDGETAYAEADELLKEKKEQLDKAEVTLENGQTQLDQAKKQLAEKQKEYDKGLDEYDNGQTSIGESRTQLKESREKLEQGEEDYSSGLDDYNEGVKAIEEARSNLAGMKDCRWLLFGVRGNPGYAHLSSTSDNISRMSITFSLFFVVIAALVIYTSVGRIIEEQRRLVGASKALGLFNREILFKYMMFGVGATVIGIILGIISGYYVIQGVVLSAYKKIYVIGRPASVIQIPMSVIILAAGTALSAIAVLLSCSKLMRSTAIQLMQEKQPRTGKRKASKAGSLYSRLIMRNIRSDIPRVIVTAVSVAGCCSLLVTGFTMRNNVSGVIGLEYGGVIRYDEKVRFDPERSQTAKGEIEKILSDVGVEKTAIYDNIHTYLGNDELQTAEIFCGDLKQFTKFYTLKDQKSGKSLSTDPDGVYIQSRTAEVFGFEKGDSITVYDKQMEPYTMEVAGVFNNYLGYTMVMTDEYYEQVFEKPAQMNTFLVKADDADQKQIEQKVKEVDGYESVSYCKDEINTMGTLVTIFTGLSGMMIIIAGLLAYFILLNINKMYISQKTKELTIMRINGFTVGEVKRYLLMETVVTSLAGIVLGIVIGSVMGYSVIRNLEAPYLMFIRRVNLIAWLLAAVITVLFTLGINVIALRKIKRLKLTDVE